MSRIVMNDGTWTTVLCGKCDLAHKVLSKHIKPQSNCPYCDEFIHLTKLEDDHAVEKKEGWKDCAEVS